MCLFVRDSFVVKPKKRRTCLKLLEWSGNCWRTPYQGRKVTLNHGHFVPRSPATRTKEYMRSESIGPGYIHAYKCKPVWDADAPLVSEIPTKVKKGDQFYFKAVAYEISAYGGEDLVCKKLYIPAFDTRRNKSCMWE